MAFVSELIVVLRKAAGDPWVKTDRTKFLYTLCFIGKVVFRGTGYLTR